MSESDGREANAGTTGRDAVRVDRGEVQDLLDRLSRHGAHGETGVWRPVYGTAWVAAQAAVADWFAEAGLAVRRDAVGNVWGRLEGTAGGGAVVTGSHIDSQLPGGRFDGALGVVGGFVAVRTLAERFGPPRRPIEVVSFCEEEASRFPTANFWGSRAVIGKIEPDEPAVMRDIEGRSMAEAMAAAGLDPARVGDARRHDLAAFIELHIEQGPILEQAAAPIGIVSAITGYRQYVVALGGTANHAGACPMDLRRDPMAGAAEIISGVIDSAHRRGRPAVTTVGRVLVEPNGRSVVPATVTFTIDARHPDADGLRSLLSAHEGLIRETASRRGLSLTLRVDSDRQPCPTDPTLVEALAEAADQVGVAAPRLTSGAVHDAQQMAAICPVAMLFVRSRAGLSHTPEEFTSLDDAVAGIETLATALARLAYEGSRKG